MNPHSPLRKASDCTRVTTSSHPILTPPDGISCEQVDYYKFGSCEISDGAYFCGDHSCKTFAHVGDKDVQENSDLWRDGRSGQQAREWLRMPNNAGGRRRFPSWGGGRRSRRLEGVY